MKYPEIIQIETALAEPKRFDTIIDVRSPSEFAEDHIPGAINCPVLDDQERIKVGTLYKQVNSFEAKKIGAALVAKNIGRHLEQLFLDKPKNWKPLIYCWRGGNRSGSMAHIFAKVGWPAAQLDGGYKSYRQHVNHTLPDLTAPIQWKVVCGSTGSGKSLLLQILADKGAQVLDLEKLAHHRGSVLGRMPSGEQPSQKNFESQIWDSLRQFDTSKTVFVEAESKKVGDLRVPDSIIEKMRLAPCINLELSVAHRIALLMEDYAHFVQDTDQLNEQINCLSALYGKAQITAWTDLAKQGNLQQLVQELLLQHYDPSYRRAIDRNFVQIKSAPQFTINYDTPTAFSDLADLLIRESQHAELSDPDHQ